MLTENVVEDARMTPWQRHILRVQQRRVARVRDGVERDHGAQRPAPGAVPHDGSVVCATEHGPARGGLAGADHKNESLGIQEVAV